MAGHLQLQPLPQRGNPQRKVTARQAPLQRQLAAVNLTYFPMVHRLRLPVPRRSAVRCLLQTVFRLHRRLQLPKVPV